ncbi:MAG TPA: DUF6588 family protein [Balneolaceae bacterium]|nr:DUF6588 family protein [Balneolaceae bacterium]
MKNIKYVLTASIFLLFAMLFQPVSALAQISDIGKLIRAGKEDAETMAKAYLSPLSTGVGAGLNDGWTTSASAHKTLGFSIQIKGSLAFIPELDQSFDLSKLTLNKVHAADPSETVSPTIGGADKVGPEIIVEDDGREVARFNLPQGIGFHFVPAPMLQASVGLIKKTDVILRYVPKVKMGDFGNFQMKGIGLQHELTQWLPAEAVFPVDISVMAAYSRTDLSAQLNIKPKEGAAPDPSYSGSYDNQQAAISFDTFTAKLIVGKDLPFISIYGAAGYQTSTMEAALTGDYPVPATVNGKTQTTTLSDPFGYKQTGNNKLSLTGGLKFKLAFFNIYGSYTLAKYPTANAGIGFSFR